jgi:hypothetical protein
MKEPTEAEVIQHALALREPLLTAIRSVIDDAHVPYMSAAIALSMVQVDMLKGATVHGADEARTMTTVEAVGYLKQFLDHVIMTSAQGE